VVVNTATWRQHVPLDFGSWQVPDPHVAAVERSVRSQPRPCRPEPDSCAATSHMRCWRQQRLRQHPRDQSCARRGHRRRGRRHVPHLHGRPVERARSRRWTRSATHAPTPTSRRCAMSSWYMMVQNTNTAPSATQSDNTGFCPSMLGTDRTAGDGIGGAALSPPFKNMSMLFMYGTADTSTCTSTNNAPAGTASTSAGSTTRTGGCSQGRRWQVNPARPVRTVRQAGRAAGRA
jgi:hypothetical protein